MDIRRTGCVAALLTASSLLLVAFLAKSVDEFRRSAEEQLFELNSFERNTWNAIISLHGLRTKRHSRKELVELPKRRTSSRPKVVGYASPNDKRLSECGLLEPLSALGDSSDEDDLACRYRSHCPRGPPGEPGEPGEPGKDGLNGTDGVDGEPWSLGENDQVVVLGCVRCPPGPPGVQGDVGFPGNAGPAGPDGPRGLIGYEGLPGSAGDAGEQGIDGYDGLPGKPGTPGENSMRYINHPGPPGRSGVAGPTEPGIPGQIGYGGLPGVAGSAGAPGIHGIHGPPGAPGEPGEPGTPGSPGGTCSCPSGYQVSPSLYRQAYSTGTTTTQVPYAIESTTAKTYATSVYRYYVKSDTRSRTSAEYKSSPSPTSYTGAQEPTTRAYNTVGSNGPPEVDSVYEGVQPPALPMDFS